MNSLYQLKKYLPAATLLLAATLACTGFLTSCSSADEPDTPVDLVTGDTSTPSPQIPVNDPEPQPEPDYTVVDRLTLDIQSDLGASGSVIAIRLDNHPLYTHAEGTILEAATPLAIASLSKPVTAYILQQMQNDGLIALSDPVGVHLPELLTLANADRIRNQTLFQFMTHNAGLAQVTSYGYPDWQSRLNEVLSQPAVSGHQYANDDYTLLTRVIMNVLGSYQAALDRYINVDGISTFRIGTYHGIPSYAGAGELEASAADYLVFMERAAPLSELQSGVYGIAWFHNPAGFLDHSGAHIFDSVSYFSLAMWGGQSASGKRVSFVLLAPGVDNSGGIIHRYLDAL